MRPYEIVFIFDADLDEETIRSVVDGAVEQITAGGGEPGRVDHWGKRRFAYELRHRSEGIFAVLQARAEAELIQRVDRTLSLSDDVLRHRVVRVPEVALDARAATTGSAEA